MRILFFGRLRDGPGAGTVPPTVRDTDALRAWLGRERPELLAQSVRMAVNDEMIVANRTLDEGDEVVFLPPVSGG